VRSRTVVIESRDGTLSLIPFSERGSAYEQQVPERREMRAFVCRQFKKQDVLWASEIQASATSARRAPPSRCRPRSPASCGGCARRRGHLRVPPLNGIQGMVKDPKDGATVVNYFTEFGITPAAEVDFDLDNASPASGALRKRCQALIESVEDSMGGLAPARCSCAPNAARPSSPISSPTRRCARPTSTPRPPPICAAGWPTRSASAASPSAATAAALGFGVPTDKAFFYPEGVEGLFEIYYAPADTFETVNTLGLPLYARMIPDRDRDEWVRLEIESNPLPICTRPQVLRSARRT
jgi:hypothetical protein